jgi:hypothetical protein
LDIAGCGLVDLEEAWGWLICGLDIAGFVMFVWEEGQYLV